MLIWQKRIYGLPTIVSLSLDKALLLFPDGKILLEESHSIRELDSIPLLWESYPILTKGTLYLIAPKVIISIDIDSLEIIVTEKENNFEFVQGTSISDSTKVASVSFQLESDKLNNSTYGVLDLKSLNKKYISVKEYKNIKPDPKLVDATYHKNRLSIQRIRSKLYIDYYIHASAYISGISWHHTVGAMDSKYYDFLSILQRDDGNNIETFLLEPGKGFFDSSLTFFSSYFYQPCKIQVYSMPDINLQYEIKLTKKFMGRSSWKLNSFSQYKNILRTVDNEGFYSIISLW